MGICYFCGKEVDLPHKCKFCNLTFCDDHRLPEEHNCSGLPERKWGAPVPVPNQVEPDITPEPDEDETPSENNVPVPGDNGKIITPKKDHIRKREIRYRRTPRFKPITTGLINILKFIGFSIFTIITAIPSIMYIYLLTVPEMSEIIGFLYVFSPSTLLQYIIPNLAYFILWFFIVYKILRKRCVWWYHLILLCVSLINWWSLGRLITISNYLAQIFEGIPL